MIRLFSVLGAVVFFALAACSPTPGLTQPTIAAPTAEIFAITPVGTVTGFASKGLLLYREKQCASCHGPTAAGGMGGALVSSTLTFDQFLWKVRNAIPPKPAMSVSDLSDSDAYSIYLWVHEQTPTGQSEQAGKTPVALPTGQLLGIQVWNDKQCAECHGAFAQGSEKALRLAGDSYPFERERAVMRDSAGEIPAHSADNINDDLLRRLLDWLRRGADPAGGC